jgi:hypothetical protein
MHMPGDGERPEPGDVDLEWTEDEPDDDASSRMSSRIEHAPFTAASFGRARAQVTNREFKERRGE